VIGRTEGLRGLFRGNSATLARIFPYAALQYMSYEQFKLVRAAHLARVSARGLCLTRCP
jgi:hypothetical protein